MPIDLDRVLGAELLETAATWGPDDVILYHLGLGAGEPFTDSRELAYTYERDLKVLPTYGVIPTLPSLVSAFTLPGMDVDQAQILHGEQELTVHGVLPSAAEVRTSGHVADVFDKGKAALVVSEMVTRDAIDDSPLFTNRHSVFMRGEGGVGPKGGPAPAGTPPARSPDHVVTRATLPQQALLYRLTGDKNPIHADPDYASLGGFDQPIMHGLCTFGMACKAVVDTALAGDVAALARYRARFSGVLFPGETLEVSMWDEPGRIVLTARCVERDASVLSNAVITLGEPNGGPSSA
jgi:acyl dehydratase